MDDPCMYMVRCKELGRIGWLDDALLFTSEAQRAALITTKNAAEYAIKLAKDNRAGLTDFMVVYADAHFEPITRDLEMVLENGS